MPPAKSWERLPRETIKQFGTFQAYLMLGSERSIEKLRAKLGKSTGRHFEKWSSENDWVKRAADYDSDQISQQSEALVTSELEGLRNRARDTYVASNLAALKLLKKLLPAIDKIDVEKLKPSEIASLVRAANSSLESSLNGEAIAIGADRLQESINNAQKADDSIS